jgi:hypothetical protein
VAARVASMRVKSDIRGLATAARDFRREWIACLGSSVNLCQTTDLLTKRTRIARSTFAGVSEPIWAPVDGIWSSWTEADEIFHKVGGGRNAFGGFGHPGGELAGPGGILRGQDGAQVGDQRFLGGGRKAPGGAHL